MKTYVLHPLDVSIGRNSSPGWHHRYGDLMQKSSTLKDILTPTGYSLSPLRPVSTVLGVARAHGTCAFLFIVHFQPYFSVISEFVLISRFVPDCISPAMQLSTYEFTAIFSGLLREFDFIPVDSCIRTSVDAFAPFMDGPNFLHVMERGSANYD